MLHKVHRTRSSINRTFIGRAGQKRDATIATDAEMPTLFLLPMVAVGVTLCDKHLQNGLKLTALPGRGIKISKNRHMMAMLLVYPYV